VRRLSSDAGSTLVLNVFVMSIFALMAVIVYKSAKTMVGEAVYYERSTQAMTIAEAGLEDAMHSLYSTSTWRTGFSQKAFANGYYTVSVATLSATQLSVVSSGYSPSFLFLGRAVKTVSTSVVFTSTAVPANAVVATNLSIYGFADAYDPRISLTPSSFTDGAVIWGSVVKSGDNLSGTGNVNTTCSVTRIFGSVLYQTTAPDASCIPATDTITSTTTAPPIIFHSCNAACQAAGVIQDAAINTLNPVTLPWNSGSNQLTVAANTNVKLSSGTYYFNKISVTGTLTVDTSSGTATLYYGNSWKESPNCATTGGCAVVNTTQIPSRLVIADLSGNSANFTSTVPLHAYLEGNANTFGLGDSSRDPAVLYGHISANTVIIFDSARVHFDVSEGVAADHVSWTTGASGTWTESYVRQ
jgi:Tfp pilus assembly protein PilX